MTARHEFQLTGRGTPEANRPSRRGRLGWMMTVGCVPLLLAALALVAAGIASPGFLVIAIGCTLMTGIMMTGRRPRHRRPHSPRLAGRSPGQAGTSRNRRRPAPGAFTPASAGGLPQAPGGAFTPPSRDGLTLASPLARLGASADQTRAYPIIRERPSAEAGSPQPGEPRSAS